MFSTSARMQMNEKVRGGRRRHTSRTPFVVKETFRIVSKLVKFKDRRVDSLHFVLRS